MPCSCCCYQIDPASFWTSAVAPASATWFCIQRGWFEHIFFKLLLPLNNSYMTLVKPHKFLYRALKSTLVSGLGCAMFVEVVEGSWVCRLRAIGRIAVAIKLK